MRKDIPISVLMPVHNAEKYLAVAIESILNQTYKNYEFLIIENGSTDKTREIIKHYSMLDTRIKPFFLDEKGFANAINFGVKEAKYDWIARMDADDISLSERIEFQLKIIKEKAYLGILGSYGYYMSENGKRILGEIRVGPVNASQFERMIKENKLIFLLNVSAIFCKQSFLELGGYREIPVLEDLDFNCRLADTGKLILATPKPLVKVRKIYTSETSSKFFLLQNTMRWIKYSMINRRKGKKEISLSEFLSILKNDSFLNKLIRYREDIGRYFFKRAGLALSYYKLVELLLYGWLSFIVTPEYVFKKLNKIFF